MVSVVRISGFFVSLAAALSAPVQADVHFSKEERDAVMKFWSAPGRYSSSKGSWQVRPTSEGSTWLWKLQRTSTPDKVSPTLNVQSRNAAWNAWIDARIAWDTYQAEKKAAAGSGKAFAKAAPKDPGAAPADLAAAIGAVPAFMHAVQPLAHTVNFGDAKLAYEDHVNIRPKFAYFRFEEGVRSYGTRVKTLPEAEVAGLFRKAGIPASSLKVMKAVSLLEGGFDSLNTCDTGFVSVGFIQFACLGGGSGSLGQVLLRMKQRWPEAFQKHFRAYGLDVTGRGVMAALDPTTGAEFTGEGAARRIIADKRLAAAFQRAGQLSEEFRIAQVQVAHEMYYPAGDVFRASFGGQQVAVRIGDVIRSEAGMATMMDRKVNTGRIAGLEAAANSIISRFNLQSPEELALFEYDLVRALSYRKDYLADPSLSGPRADSRTALQSARAQAQEDLAPVEPEAAPEPKVESPAPTDAPIGAAPTTVPEKVEGAEVKAAPPAVGAGDKNRP
jgi:hypothetical protein